MPKIKWLLFDWGDTLMYDNPSYTGEMVLWPEIALMEGVLSTLPKLADEYQRVVVSNATDSNAATMKAAFERMGIDRYFSFFITSNEIGYKKPDERFFTANAEKLNTPMNELCMIGNDYQKDIVTPKKLSMKTVLITSAPGDYPSADHTVSRFDELISIFGKNIRIRPATPADINALASMNKQLIEDEKHNNPMTVRQLKERMEGFLSGDYTALIFADADGGTIGYALVNKTTDPLYLRQFFICRDERRKGYGRRFFINCLIIWMLKR